MQSSVAAAFSTLLKILPLTLLVSGCGGGSSTGNSPTPAAPATNVSAPSSLSAPTAPSSLTARSLSSSQILLSWADNNTTETGFEVERKTGSGVYARIGTTSANGIIYNDIGLAASTTYSYRVRAVNGAGNSTYSNEAGVITSAVVAPLVQRFADNGNGTVTDNQTRLVWLKNANCTEAIAGKTPSPTLTWDEAMDWSAAVQSGKCGLTDGSAAGTWRLPSIEELLSLSDAALGNQQEWLNSGVYSNVGGSYWSSSLYSCAVIQAWSIDMSIGSWIASFKEERFYVWPVR